MSVFETLKRRDNFLQEHKESGLSNKELSFLFLYSDKNNHSKPQIADTIEGYKKYVEENKDIGVSRDELLELHEAYEKDIFNNPATKKSDYVASYKKFSEGDTDASIKKSELIILFSQWKLLGLDNAHNIIFQPKEYIEEYKKLSDKKALVRSMSTSGLIEFFNRNLTGNTGFEIKNSDQQYTGEIRIKEKEIPGEFIERTNSSNKTVKDPKKEDRERLEKEMEDRQNITRRFQLLEKNFHKDKNRDRDYNLPGGR